MPAPSKRPSPPRRMVELLATEKRRLLAEKGHTTRADFTVAWERSWETMVLERGWAHATKHRRNARRSMRWFRIECRAAFVDRPTAFSLAASRLSEAADGMCLHLEPGQLTVAILSSLAYVAASDRDEANAALAAQQAFAAMPAQLIKQAAQIGGRT